VDVRILSNANDSDNDEHSRTAAKSAALLHVLVHDHAHLVVGRTPEAQMP